MLTAGINLDRFNKNPILLYNHKDGTDPSDVIGKWLNIRVEGNQLLSEPELDEEDDLAKRLSAKIDKGYINAASIRLDFKYDDVKLDVPGFEGVPVVTKCEIMEASIVALPNNKNAVKLFADGKVVEDNSVALSLSNTNQNPINTTMKELGLIFAALGLTLNANSTDAHAVEAINSLKAERDSIKLKLDEATAALKLADDEKVTALIQDGIAKKKLKAEDTDKYTKLAKQDFATTKAIIDGMTPHASLASQLNAGETGDGGKDKYEGWDYKKFQKEAPGVLLSMKTEQPDKYKKLWQEAFPSGKFNS